MLVSAAGWAGAFHFSNVRLAVHEQHMQPPPELSAAGGAAAAAAAAGGAISGTGTSPNTSTNAGGVGDGGDASTGAKRTSALGAPPAAASDFSSFLHRQNLAVPGSYPSLCVIVPPGAQLPMSSRSYRRVTTGVLLGIDLLVITAGVDNSSSDSDRVKLEQAYFGNLVESYSRGASMRLDTRDVVGTVSARRLAGGWVVWWFGGLVVWWRNGGWWVAGWRLVGGGGGWQAAGLSGTHSALNVCPTCRSACLRP